ncbi:type II CAAX prenyl endopeptidase Rce1 family protein [Zeaxanthinibacter enoshimensis]|uniref:CPBP family glutamic-type intramembrane protease n=1 Tax=Zeaxanthinibacter enoshimensis TaxID=392009 RepID=UPI0035613C6F
MNREKLDTGSAFRVLWASFLINISISITIAVLLLLFITPQHTGIELINKRYSGLELILVVILVLPVLEEFMFRLPLVFKPLYQAISVSIATYCCLFIALKAYTDFQPWPCILISAATSFCLGTGCYFGLKKYQKKAAFIFSKYYPIIFYLHVALFGCLHVWNYGAEPGSAPVLLLLTLPQAVSAIILGYLRVRYGLIYAFVLHSMVNILPVLMV